MAFESEAQRRFLQAVNPTLAKKMSEKDKSKKIPKKKKGSKKKDPRKQA